MDDTPPARVAVFERAQDLGPGRPVYAITYSEDGQPTARGFARGDELELWRSDLEEGGWQVVIKGDAS